MSNVLIGIIGVILFIGLALAGALILGDDFRSASHDSKAAASVQTLSQVAAAVNMHNLKRGTSLSGGTLTTLVPRFLKAVPVNPTGGFAPDLHSAASDYTGPAAFAVMEIRNEGACLAINQQMGVAQTVPPLDNYPSWQGGCYRQGAPRGFNVANILVGFVRI